MGFFSTLPSPQLVPAVQLLSCFDGYRPRPAFERLFPPGMVEVVINLTDGELRCYSAPDQAARRLHGPIVSGVDRGHFFVDTEEMRSAIGVQLRPGRAWRLFGVPADELAGVFVLL